MENPVSMIKLPRKAPRKTTKLLAGLPTSERTANLMRKDSFLPARTRRSFRLPSSPLPFKSSTVFCLSRRLTESSAARTYMTVGTSIPKTAAYQLRLQEIRIGS